MLRPGGVLYVDLEPNRAFWQRDRTASRDEWRRSSATLDEIVAREVRAVLHVEDDVRDRFAIPPETFRSAEYIKSHLGGFEPSEFEADARAAGFRSCDTTHEWFLGQAVLMHGEAPADAATVEAHLRRLLPGLGPALQVPALRGDAMTETARTADPETPRHDPRAGLRRRPGRARRGDRWHDEGRSYNVRSTRTSRRGRASEYPDAWMVHNLMVRASSLRPVPREPRRSTRTCHRCSATRASSTRTRRRACRRRARTSRTASTSTRPGSFRATGRTSA